MKSDPNEYLNVNKGPGTHSRRRFSMNSGLNRSPVTYSTEDENAFGPVDRLRTQPMLVGERWDDACREVGPEVIPEENEVLKASPRRWVRGGEYWEIGLRRCVIGVEILRIRDDKRTFAETR
jgi:hypothetical protein